MIQDTDQLYQHGEPNTVLWAFRTIQPPSYIIVLKQQHKSLANKVLTNGLRHIQWQTSLTSL